MAGCSGGTVAVTLRHSETNKILATVTVTVLDRPVIERYEEMAYRWFHIYWRCPEDGGRGDEDRCGGANGCSKGQDGSGSEDANGYRNGYRNEDHNRPFHTAPC